VGSGGTLSIEVLGVDRVSIELPGRLLADELVDAKFFKLIITLCGLCFVFPADGPDLVEGTVRFSAVWLRRDLSNLGLGTIERRRLGVMLPVDFESFARPSSSVLLSTVRFGDGDLDDVIHDLRANVANDSDRGFALFSLSRVALVIVGTGGASNGVVFDTSEECRSGDLLARCIQDFGRATKDFLLPTLSNFGLSSTFASPLPAFASFVFNFWFSLLACEVASDVDTLCTSFSG
jgi:hypothetical protein